MTEKIAQNTAPPRAGRREWLGLAILALPCLLYSMDFTVLHLAVPHLINDLKPSSSQLLWIIDIYGFLLAGALIAMGVAGDRFGRRKLLLIGAGVFGFASVLAAFADSPEALIASRALLGVAAATLAPSTLSLIRNMFLDSKQRSLAIGVWVASFSAGAAIGPLVGGALLTQFWWGSVFLVGVPAMVLLLILGPRLLPEYRDPDAGRLDLWSVGLSVAGVLSTIYGIKDFAENGLGLVSVAACLVGLALVAGFIRRQQTSKKPFINLSLFRSRAFGIMLVVYLLIFFVNFSAFLFITQYLQLILGMGPLEAGLWTLPWATSFVVGAMAGPALATKIRPVYIIIGSLLVTALGFGLLTQIGNVGALWLIVLGSVIFPLGLGPVVTLITDLIIGSAPPKQAGMASGLSETGSELGGALGIALVGSAAAILYRNDLKDALPEGIPHAISDVALETFGGAFVAAEQLPAAMGSQLITAAQAAFTSSAVLAFVICAIVTLGAAILTATVAGNLKGVKVEHEE